MPRQRQIVEDEDPEFELVDNENVAQKEQEEFERRREQDQGGWVEIRDNPSGTKFYKLRGTPLKIFDRKVLSHINDANSADIIDSCIRNHVHGVQLEDLLYQERKWLIFWLRFHSFLNTLYEVTWNCDCEMQNTMKISIGDFKIFKPDDSLKLTGNRITLKSGKSATFRMETFRLHYQIIKFWENIQAQGIVKNEAEKSAFLEMAYMAILMEEYDGRKLPGATMEALDFLNSLPVNDYNEMEAYLNDVVVGWGVSSKIQAECEKCGRKTLLNVNFRGEFFVSKNQHG